jgi:hypothetical protein
MLSLIHKDILSFIGDTSDTNVAHLHKIGFVSAYSFRKPAIKIYFMFDGKKIKEYFIRFGGQKYSEEEFLHMLKLKLFW